MRSVGDAAVVGWLSPAGVMPWVTSGVVCRSVTAAIAFPDRWAAQASRGETRQLSQSGAAAQSKLTKSYQAVEQIMIFSAIRQAFCWHAGCWLSGVSMRTGEGASCSGSSRRGFPVGVCRHVEATAAGAGKGRGKTL
jgi:hypothetical protein